MISASAIQPGDHWREVWHLECPGDGARFGPSPSSPMKPLSERLISGGHSLHLYECTGCHERVYAGLDENKRITTRPAPEGELAKGAPE